MKYMSGNQSVKCIYIRFCFSQIHSETDQPWRLRILEELKGRIPSQDVFRDYQPAVDTTSWVHTGEARVNLGAAFVDCVLQLEWVESCGTLTVLNQDGVTTMVSRVRCMVIENL